MSPRAKLWLKRLALGLVLLPLWLGTGALAAAGLYLLKQEQDINIFSRTGFHGLMRCVVIESQKIEPLSAAPHSMVSVRSPQ